MTRHARPFDRTQLFAPGAQPEYSGENLLQIAMPLGGIGAGSVCLNGQGGLQDFSIRNKPNLTSVPDVHTIKDCAFATLYFPALGVARMVEGPMPPERVYNLGLKGQGFREGGHEGLPRFRNCTFQGEYPFGAVRLDDPTLPLAVTVTGFNPFIPLDDKNSSIPCAILEYELRNTSGEAVEYQFGYHISHFAHDGTGRDFGLTRNAIATTADGEKIGVYLTNLEDPNGPFFGSCAMGVVGHAPEIKAMWFRGGWFDSISSLWREISTGSFTTNDGAKADTSMGRNGGSILLKGRLAPGERITYPIVITWYFPNAHYQHGQPPAEETGSTAASAGDAGCIGCECPTQPPCWRPYYASQWSDAQDVLRYVSAEYGSLRRRTQAFHDALFRSTLPPYVLEAVSANLGILKSPTVLRQEDGSLWAWEGCFADSGCCHGSCTHVWNYAQALPHLFPALERSLREQELRYSMDEQGHVTFRSALPKGPTTHNFHAASDGQLGGIMKLYREWQISGDREWMLSLYPQAKRSMDYCIATWDPDRLGVLVEPHHNTYDIEFWGPDGMCSSFYLGALAAMAQLARDAGYPEDAVEYEELAQKGARYLDEHLFNGEYYEQKVMLMGLRASPTEQGLALLEMLNPEEAALMRTEGPKYQYGTGCISDGVFGAWLARLCFVDSPQNRDHVRENLRAIFAYNFKTSLWEHANPQRPGYAIGDEPGLLLCTWPRGGKPTLPFVYSDEVWTGIEYQVASHLIAEGLVEEGLTVVKAARSRFDGRARNPWNEYECGNFYARAMASYGLLIALGGFRYSRAEKTLELEPRLDARPFELFFSTATGWGTIKLSENELVVRMEEGYLEIDRLLVRVNGQEKVAAPRVKAEGQETVLRL